MRVLVSVKAGSLGHLLPLVPLARAARAADHDLIFASSPDRDADVGAFGFDFAPCGLPFACGGSRCHGRVRGAGGWPA